MRLDGKATVRKGINNKERAARICVRARILREKVHNYKQNRAKIAFFCRKICTIKKKAVPLHPLLKKARSISSTE